MPLSVTLLGHYPPPFGGVASLMRQMEVALRSSGCSVCIMNLGHGKPDAANVTNFSTTNRFREVLELRTAIAASGSDVLHYVTASYRSFWLASVCLMLAWLSGKTMVVSFVGGAFPDFINGLGPAKRWWARTVLRRAAALIPCNDEIAEVVEELVPEKGTTQITNSFPVTTSKGSALPVEVEAFVSSRGPVVCSTGAAAREYGLLDAVAAVDRLRGSHPNLGFVLVLTRYGTDEYEERLQSEVEARGLSDTILIARNLPDFVALLERSDVFLRSTLVDGDSMSVRESLYLGVPAVASDTAFRPDGTIVFRKGDDEDMAVKLETALERGRGDSTGAREESERNLETLLDVYRSVTRRAAGS